MAAVESMSGRLQRTKDILSDPLSAMSDKIYMIGLLAIALIGTDCHDAIAEEARGTVVAFWQEMAVAR